MTLTVLILYLSGVLGVGFFGQRLFRGTGEDYFVASRSIGPFVLLMSLFGTHMTAFSLLGASGESYRVGLGVFSLMASSSAIVVPLVFFFIGTRVWALGARYGYLTQPQLFRDRFESDGLGLALFIVLVALVLPYLLIGVLGGGLTLTQITGGQVPPWVGGLVISLVVIAYVTAGGLRGTAWVNTFQTLVFMVLGAVTLVFLVRQLGGLEGALARVGAARPELLVRGDAVPPIKLFGYVLIPLSAGMFPHLFMHWLSAKKATSFRLPIIAYPLCIAAVWVPSVLLGVLGHLDFPDLQGPQASSVLVRMIDLYATDVLAGLLGAGVFAAVMSSLDSQVLSLSNLFSQDVVRHYRLGTMSDAAHVRAGRLFVIGLIGAAYALSFVADSSIFGLAVWSFTGFSGLFPLIVAALYWRRATTAGAWASLGATASTWAVFFALGRSTPGYTVAGLLPVVWVVAASATAMIVVSLATRPPSERTLRRFFPGAKEVAG